MENFVKFLRYVKESLNAIQNFQKVHIILGNESCDLDSTICTLSLGFLLHNGKQKNELVVPILNCQSKYFHLRTEICYLLKRQNIDQSQLIFKNDVNFSSFNRVDKIETTLVDHHVLAPEDKFLTASVMRIFDHRPINKDEICKHETLVINPVGSCATLIAQEYIKKNPDLLRVYKGLTYLLYATIIYDTIGLDQSVGRTTDTDINVADYLENIIKPQQTRTDLFQQLWTIHNDTSRFTCFDLLFRDLKITKNIPVAGLPLLVEEYLKKDNADNALQHFAEEFKADIVVLIGINADNGVRRDIGIYYKNTKSKDLLVTTLKNDQQLELTQSFVNNENVICFRQNNITLTRKYILPLINKAALCFNVLS